MDRSERGQVVASAAEVYEEFFVPALFQEWTGRVADAAGVGTGDRVLDVACGTGVLARAVAERVGTEGAVVGLDVNEGMLAVARRQAPGIGWRRAAAEQLPFPDGSFDAVVSQFGLMFFGRRADALREMVRVLAPGGRLAVAVWASLDDTPGYAAMTELLRRLFGAALAGALEAPYALGDSGVLRALLTEAGLAEAEVVAAAGKARFASIEAWVHTDIRGWTLADVLDDTQYRRLLGEAQRALAGFVDADGRVVFQAPAHLVIWRKPAAS